MQDVLEIGNGLPLVIQLWPNGLETQRDTPIVFRISFRQQVARTAGWLQG
jgi:hypothetical protein